MSILPKYNWKKKQLLGEKDIVKEKNLECIIILKFKKPEKQDFEAEKLEKQFR